MTPFVQPLNAGVIRCFKAHYQRQFCEHAIKLDEAEEANIYKIDLLEAMLITQKAWAAVTAKTIVVCWHHSEILPPSSSELNTDEVADAPALNSNVRQIVSHKDDTAWNIVTSFANGEIGTMSVAEEKLKAHLGDHYRFQDWKPAFDTVFAAEDDMEAALLKVMKLHDSAIVSTTASSESTTASHASDVTGKLELPELTEAEDGLMAAIDGLQARRRVHGECPTLEDLLNSVEEQEVNNSQY
ncbi:hypothetical protein EIP86_001628 [Pleurotus ostreatoroseus]|nr:hypothetical protein EIP86_001628 [Pleurotus ostreatoroseus]